MSQLPRDYVDRLVQKASTENLTAYGKRMNEMTREELIAVAVDGWTRHEALLTQRLAQPARRR